MGKSRNQKLSLLYLIKILREYTDKDHAISREEIQDKLNEYGIEIERKTVYSDIEELELYGIGIERIRESRNTLYRSINREFDLAELKYLVDCVQASRFLTEEHSRKLIKKLEQFASKYEAGQLNRQVIISGRVKTMNDKNYDNIDVLHKAMGENKQVSFKYMEWTLAKTLVPRRNGAAYEISPWAVALSNEKYYMIGFDAEYNQLKHYRIDKMTDVALVEKARLGRERFEEKNVKPYSERLFDMFGGKTKKVSIEADNSLVGVFIDRFGSDIPIMKRDNNRFATFFDVEVSSRFLGWLFSLGDQVTVTSPEDVVLEMKAQVESVLSLYQK